MAWRQDLWHDSLLALCREMLVQWSTLNAEKPVARWGTQSGRYEHAVAADTDTYTRKASQTSPPVTQ